MIGWAAAEGLALETLPPQRAGEFYEKATSGLSASHHLQVKAALSLLYHVLSSPNPFRECLARPNSLPRKLCCATTPLRNSASSCAKESYFGHLTYRLASALFFTGCRFHQWALLTVDRLIREPGGAIIAVRLQLKGGSFRDLPLTPELSDSLAQWFAFLESVKGVRLRGWGVDFAGSQLVFPGRDGAPFSNQAFNARIKLACKRARVPVISAHPLRHTAAKLLLNERGANLGEVQALLGHKSPATMARYTHVDSERLRTLVGNRWR